MTTRVARHQQIMDHLAANGDVSVEALATHFQVSAMTIRRDLDLLEATGFLSRVHGGAVVSPQGVAAFTFPTQMDSKAPAKAAIAAAVAAQVKPGMAISLDTGSTTLAVARALLDHQRLTVLTTSLAIAATLQACEQIDTILLGGNVRRHSPDLTGPLAEDNLKRFHVDMAIMGADAITAQGSYTTDLNIARVTSAMAEQANQVILVADSTKFTRTAFYQCLRLEQVDTLVTDDGCPPSVRDWLEGAPPAILYVPASS